MHYYLVQVLCNAIIAMACVALAVGLLFGFVITKVFL